MVNDETLCSIRNLADYIIEDKIEGLFDDALTVRKWLDVDSVAFGTCPRCKKESMEIHGEGISDRGNYPMENCLYCGFIPKDFNEYSGTARKKLSNKEVKDWLINFLESWDTTFEEETEIPALIDKIKNDETMTTEEHYELLFHLWQKFYDVD